VFSEPWHAQIFAMTVHLCQRGVFTWPRWAENFGATLARHGLDRDLNGGEDYYTAWLETLENALVGAELTENAEIAALVDAWRDAYLATPHGQPVALKA